MSITRILKIEALNYREGFDVTLETLLDGNLKKNITFFWPGKIIPDEKILKDKISHLEFQANKTKKEINKRYSESDIENLLIEKKYLLPGQKLKDLPIKTKEIK